MSSEHDLRCAICEIGRRVYDRGYVAANDGNISCRLGDGRYLCTPTGVSKGYIDPADIAVVDGEGHQLSGDLRCTSEIRLHLAIYRELAHIHAVCHAHPPHATAFAVAGLPLPVGILPEVEIFLGPVPLADYDTPGSSEFANTILPHLRNKANTILLANHGVVACDKDLTQAYFHIETVDMYARILLLAKQVGRVRQLPASKIDELLELKKRMGIEDPRLDGWWSPPGDIDAFLKTIS